jgi:hypothetical protein
MSSGTSPIELNRWPEIDHGMIVAKAAELAVPRPTKFEPKFERIVDLYVARTLGLDVPFTARADEVIE